VFGYQVSVLLGQKTVQGIVALASGARAAHAAAPRIQIWGCIVTRNVIDAHMVHHSACSMLCDAGAGAGCRHFVIEHFVDQ